VSGECERRYLSTSEFNQFRICSNANDLLNENGSNGFQEKAMLARMFSNISFYVMMFLILSLLLPVFGMVIYHFFKDYTFFQKIFSARRILADKISFARNKLKLFRPRVKHFSMKSKRNKKITLKSSNQNS